MHICDELFGTVLAVLAVLSSGVLYSRVMRMTWAEAEALLVVCAGIERCIGTRSHGHHALR